MSVAGRAVPVVSGVREHLLSLQRRHAIPVIVLPLVGAAILGAFRFHPTPLRIGLFASLYAASTLGITVGYHRLFTHGAFSCSPAARVALGALGCLAAEGPPLHWVANHRLHHQESDRTGDPHSPRKHGPGVVNRLRSFWHAHVGWMLTELPADPLRYAPDLLRDSSIARLNRWYLTIVAAGLLGPALVGLLAWGGAAGFLDGLLWGGLGRVFAVQHVTWCINSVCHLAGTRRWDTRDDSRNNAVLGILAFGEGWHNNHHAAPTSAAHGLAWWQLDVSFAFIRLLETAGVAREVQIADTARLARRLS